MEHTENSQKEAARETGAIMWIAWVVILGPLGALLLGILAYSMLANYLVLGAFCIALALSPILLTVTWGLLMLRQILRQSRERKVALPGTTAPIGFPGQSSRGRLQQQ
jgi:hypothetical protein